MTSTCAASNRGRVAGSAGPSTTRRMRRRGSRDPSLRQSQLREPGLGLSSALAGLPICLLGVVELAAQPMKLALLVEGGARRRMRGSFDDPPARPLDLLHGVEPLTLQSHDLRAMHEALTAVGDEIRLRFAPTAQCRGPLLGSAQVEDLLAGLDHTAIDVADDDGSDLAGRDRRHGLVEQPHTLGGLAHVDERAALTVPGEGDEIDVVKAIADLDGSRERLAGGRGVAPEDRLQCDQVLDVSLLDAVEPRVVEQPLRSCDPSGCGSQLAPVQQLEHQPEGAACGTRFVAHVDQLLVPARPRVSADLVVADEVGGNREPLEIRRLERRLVIGSQQLSTGTRPRLQPELLSAAIERVRLGQGHEVVRSARRDLPLDQCAYLKHTLSAVTAP